MWAVPHHSLLLLLLVLLHPFSGTRKANHSGFFWSKRWWGGSGITWTICKSFAPCCRQISTPVPQHSVFTGRMPFLMPNQQRQSTEGIRSTEMALEGHEKFHQYTGLERMEKQSHGAASSGFFWKMTFFCIKCEQNFQLTCGNVL